MLTPNFTAAKQGLLSLDPDTGYDHCHQDNGFVFDDDSGIESQQRQAFGEVARAGDIITFYVFDPAQAAESQPDDVWLQSGNETPTTWPSIVLATIPSNIDAMPAPAPSEEGIFKKPSFDAENYFGMASEGMALTVTRCVDERSKQTACLLRTKIDVPHTRYSQGFQHQ